MKSLSAVILAIFIFASAPAAGQQGGFNPAGRGQAALEEPFLGVTNDGTVREGLYEIAGAGASTAPVRDAAQHFIAALSEEQRERLLFPVDDSEWRNWANIHRFPRQGVSLDEMSEKQREKAYALLRASLSAKGYETSRDIMRLNHHLAELISNFDDYGEHLYWFTVMGEPSDSAPWGWQIDGHHLVINYFVLGDQVVMTPTFMGSEPIAAASGAYEGVSIFAPEQALALEFMQSLPEAQRRIAQLSDAKGRGENLSEMFRDNVTVPYQGLRADRMSEDHRETLMALAALYVGNIRDKHAAVKMDEVRRHLDETYFAWIGKTDDDAVFYYRIQSPVILIEFDHQGPIALSGPRGEATRQHIHSVVRTPNGNDYGKDLLRQHYEAHAGDPAHGHDR
jgi:hypothetical protein